MDAELQREWDEAIARARSVYADETEWEPVLAVLRSEGYNMSIAHKATIAVLGVDSSTAIRVVLDSSTWADQRVQFIETNEGFAQALKERADEWQEDDESWQATIHLRKRRRWWEFWRRW